MNYIFYANFLRLVLYKIFDKLSELDKNREAVTKKMKFLSETDPQEFLNKVKLTFDNINMNILLTDCLSGHRLSSPCEHCGSEI